MMPNGIHTPRMIPRELLFEGVGSGGTIPPFTTTYEEIIFIPAIVGWLSVIFRELNVSPAAVLLDVEKVEIIPVILTVFPLLAPGLIWFIEMYWKLSEKEASIKTCK